MNCSVQARPERWLFSYQLLQAIVLPFFQRVMQYKNLYIPNRQQSVSYRHHP